MEILCVFVFLWVVSIMIYRTYIKFSILRRHKQLIDKLSVDRFLLYVPEISPLGELKTSNDLVLRKIYKTIASYKILFWGGFVIVFTIFMLI